MRGGEGWGVRCVWAHSAHRFPPRSLGGLRCSSVLHTRRGQRRGHAPTTNHMTACLPLMPVSRQGQGEGSVVPQTMSSEGRSDSTAERSCLMTMKGKFKHTVCNSLNSRDEATCAGHARQPAGPGLENQWPMKGGSTPEPTCSGAEIFKCGYKVVT